MILGIILYGGIHRKGFIRHFPLSRSLIHLKRGILILFNHLIDIFVYIGLCPIYLRSILNFSFFKLDLLYRFFLHYELKVI